MAQREGQCSEIENDWYTYHDKICALAHFLNLQDYFIHAKDPVDDVNTCIEQLMVLLKNKSTIRICQTVIILAL